VRLCGQGSFSPSPFLTSTTSTVFFSLFFFWFCLSSRPFSFFLGGFITSEAPFPREPINFRLPLSLFFLRQAKANLRSPSLHQLRTSCPFHKTVIMFFLSSCPSLFEPFFSLLSFLDRRPILFPAPNRPSQSSSLPLSRRNQTASPRSSLAVFFRPFLLGTLGPPLGH